MSLFRNAARPAVVAMLLCMAGAAVAAESDKDAEKSAWDEVKAALEELKKVKQNQPQQTVNAGAIATESWLLASTAINGTASKIHDSVKTKVAKEGGKVVVLAGTETPDANQAGMLRVEMDALSARIEQASDLKCASRTGSSLAGTMAPAAAFNPAAGIAAAAAIADLLKTNTELTALSQTVDSKLVAASVAGQFSGTAVIPSAAIAAGTEGALLRQFKQLVVQAALAQRARDELAVIDKPNDCQKLKIARLTAPLASFDTFYGRVTTAKDGFVPIIVADRLDRILDDQSLVLRVNTESSGGTLVKRTNLLTALGAEAAFISGALVTSYQLTNPRTGQLFQAGVITCRTTLTSLKRVQQGTWTSKPGYKNPTAACSP